MSSSAPTLPCTGSGAASLPRSGQPSRLSGASTSTSKSSQRSQRSQLLKSIGRESHATLADAEKKWGVQARSPITDYYQVQEDARDRDRAKQLAMPLHLRTGTSSTDMGCPIEYVTQTHRAANVPIKMAVDPKWSTDLKKVNDRVGLRIEYERRLSASIPGSMSPELPFMFPKGYVSNPPSPYAEPGNLPRQRK